MADQEKPGSEPWSGTTIQAIIAGCEPMGDLASLAIEDLTEGDEETFFGVLEQL